MIEHHKSRVSSDGADGGLIVTEATVVHPDAFGAQRTPGIWSDVQIAAWRKVTDAIHAKGGIAFCQLWAQG